MAVLLRIFHRPENISARSGMITAVITIMPIALATIVEHIGDISAISSTTGINYIKDPGLHRTLLGDGLATIVASLFAYFRLSSMLPLKR